MSVGGTKKHTDRSDIYRQRIVINRLICLEKNTVKSSLKQPRFEAESMALWHVMYNTDVLKHRFNFKLNLC